VSQTAATPTTGPELLEGGLLKEQNVSQTEATPTRRSGGRAVQLARFRDLALVPAIIVLVIVGAVIPPVFLSRDNITNVLQQQTELSLLVLAEAIILIAGKFDLSLESTVGLAPALSIGLVIPAASNGLGTNWPQWTAIPICLLIGALVGAFNGMLILKFKLSAFIVTLGMLIVCAVCRSASPAARTSSWCQTPSSSSAPGCSWACPSRSGSAPPLSLSASRYLATSVLAARSTRSVAMSTPHELPASAPTVSCGWS
jgi:ABC-type xylose transport system permease subunit